ncbi:hypothetical protein [Planotetraspora silvatica]|nr:hypothetical protein [Planotetraspora silvatica]
MKKKTAAAIVALVVAAVLGGSVAPAAAVSSPCGDKVFTCDSTWMDPGPANGS